MKFTSNIHPMIYLGHVHFQAKSQSRPGHLKFLSCPLHGGLPIWQFSFTFFTNINPWGNNVLTTISRPKSQRSRSHRTFKFLLYLFLLCPLRGYWTMDGADTVKTDTAKTIWPILFIYCTSTTHKGKLCHTTVPGQGSKSQSPSNFLPSMMELASNLQLPSLYHYIPFTVCLLYLWLNPR